MLTGIQTGEWKGNGVNAYGEGITIQPYSIPVTAVDNNITDCAIGIWVHKAIRSSLTPRPERSPRG